MVGFEWRTTGGACNSNSRPLPRLLVWAVDGSKSEESVAGLGVPSLTQALDVHASRPLLPNPDVISMHSSRLFWDQSVSLLLFSVIVCSHAKDCHHTPSPYAHLPLHPALVA